MITLSLLNIRESRLTKVYPVVRAISHTRGCLEQSINFLSPKPLTAEAPYFSFL